MRSFHPVAGDAHSLSDDTVMALHQHSDGALWIGTRSGLNRLDVDAALQGRFTHYSLHDGAAGSAIFGILEDRKGVLVAEHQPRRIVVRPRARAVPQFLTQGRSAGPGVQRRIGPCAGRRQAGVRRFRRRQPVRSGGHPLQPLHRAGRRDQPPGRRHGRCRCRRATATCIIDAGAARRAFRVRGARLRRARCTTNSVTSSGDSTTTGSRPERGTTRPTPICRPATTAWKCAAPITTAPGTSAPPRVGLVVDAAVVGDAPDVCALCGPRAAADRAPALPVYASPRARSSPTTRAISGTRKSPAPRTVGIGRRVLGLGPAPQRNPHDRRRRS